MSALGPPFMRTPRNLAARATVRHAWACAAVLAAAALAAGALAWHWCREASVEDSTRRHLLARLVEVTARPPGEAPAADFTAALPAAVDRLAVFDHLRKTAAEHAVVISTLAATSQAPSLQHLGRMDVSITLRGGYGALKDVLGAVLGRFPNAVLQHAQWRRLGAAPGEVEASLELSLLERPLPDAASARSVP